MTTTKFFYPTEVIIEPGGYQRFLDFFSKKPSHLFVVTGKKSMKDAGILDKITDISKKKKIDCFFHIGVNSNPTNFEVDKICKICKEFKTDTILGIGGTSSIDAAKIVSMLITNGGESWDYINTKERKAKVILKESIPVIAIPTTSGGGSESTPYAVITHEKTRMKKGMKSKWLYPSLAIIDPKLLQLMPQKIVSISGFDAFGQCLEAYTSKNSNFISDYFSYEGLRTIVANFEKSWLTNENIEFRKNMGWAALLSGLAISITDTNLAHAMSHPLSARNGIEHGLGVLICTFQSIRYNSKVIQEKYRKIAKLFGVNNKSENPIDFLINQIFSWVEKFDLKISLKDYNISKSSLEEFTNDALQLGGLYTNSRSINHSQLLELYSKIWDGNIE